MARYGCVSGGGAFSPAPGAVCAGRCDRPRYVSPVAEAMRDVVIAVSEVPARDVVHVPVPVVVDAVDDFPGIRPDVGGDVGVRGVKPRIDDRDHDSIPQGKAPRAFCPELPEPPEILVRLPPGAGRLVI